MKIETTKETTNITDGGSYKKWVAVDELAQRLDKVYDIFSDDTLSFEERISMAKLRLLEIDTELKGEGK